LKGVFDPVYVFALYGNHIKAAGAVLPLWVCLQEAVRGGDDFALLSSGYAGRCATKGLVFAVAGLNKNQAAIMLYDKVYFALVAAEIASNKLGALLE